MKIWLDDIRTPPDDSWIWAKNAYFCSGALSTGRVTHISFDHDLGLLEGNHYEDNNGYEVAKMIEESAATGHIWNGRMKCIIPPLMWDIHSANPEGRRNIEMAMKSAERFWNEKYE